MPISNDNLSPQDPKEFAEFVVQTQHEMGWNNAVLGAMMAGIMVNCFKLCGMSKGTIIAYVADFYDRTEDENDG